MKMMELENKLTMILYLDYNKSVRVNLYRMYFYVLQIVIWFIILDCLLFKMVLGFGAPRDHVFGSDEYVPSSYIGHIREEVAVSDRTSPLYNESLSMFKDLKEDDLKVAFFAGSTGLVGTPSLCDLIRDKLVEKLGGGKKTYLSRTYLCLAEGIDSTCTCF